MAKSTNSISSLRLFHFTERMDYLQSWLTDGIPYTWQVERFPINSKKNVAFATREICFCDIPMSRLKDHVETYGHYGIGVNKLAAQDKGISPVMYVSPKSPILPGTKKDVEVLFKEYPELACRIKQLSGYRYVEKGESEIKQSVYYYDEKEWRAIPGKNPIEVLPKTHHKDIVAKRNQNNQDFPHQNFNDNLQFDIVKDITYIIIEKQKDLPSMIDFLKDKFPNEYESILPKILFFDQLKYDL